MELLVEDIFDIIREKILILKEILIINGRLLEFNN